MPIKDPEKRREYRRKWYSKNKDSEKKHVFRRKKEILLWFENYKNNLPCDICKENHPATLDFHHKEKNTKEFGINVLVHQGYSLEKIKRELEKCQVLCSNCHRKIHYKNRNSNI
jgi:hypothetical protein